MFSSKTPWIVVLILWIIGSIWWHTCRIKQLCLGSDNTPQTTHTHSPQPSSPSYTGLVISDGQSFSLSSSGNFSFPKSGATINQTGLDFLIDSLANYLKTNPGKTLQLSGYYAQQETNSTTFQTLGLARAESLKNQLVSLGVPASQINTQGVLTQELKFTPAGDSLYGGLAFSFPVAAITPVTEEVLAKAEKFESVFKPIDLYFKTGQQSYIRTEETAEFFGEAAKFLSTNKDKKLVLTGHTDNVGNDATNLQLSRKRAYGVREMLLKTGIPDNQISVQAKGETEPKAPNDTEEGRKANRRVTVVVQ